MRRLYLFALFLVLYELTVYCANDMILPGMIQVIKDFNAGQEYVALSLSYYILGNCALLLFIGYLSERFGKRKIILIGNAFFLLFTVLITFSQNISQFMLLRFFEGCGLSVIAIGYALIHEKFDDKQAVKLISLMANISLLAPLAGPALGSAVVSYFTWHYIFFILAVVGVVTLLGLYQYTPTSKRRTDVQLNSVIKQYWQIANSDKFLLGTVCVAFVSMPLLLWISQAPNLVIYKLQQSYTHYVIYQIIGIGGLTIASILIQFIAGKYRMYSLVTAGSLGMLLGLLISAFGASSIVVVVAGFFIYSLGVGIANGCLMRTLMSSKLFPLGMIAAMLGFIQTFLYVVGIAVTNSICSYFDFSLLSFCLCALAFGGTACILIRRYSLTFREREWR